jgi:hypothetical protein
MTSIGGMGTALAAIDEATLGSVVDQAVQVAAITGSRPSADPPDPSRDRRRPRSPTACLNGDDARGRRDGPLRGVLGVLARRRAQPTPRAPRARRSSARRRRDRVRAL